MEKPEQNDPDRGPSEEELRAKNRRIIVLALVLGIFLATLGFISGKNMRAERDANQNSQAAVVVVLSPEELTDVL